MQLVLTNHARAVTVWGEIRFLRRGRYVRHGLTEFVSDYPLKEEGVAQDRPSVQRGVLSVDPLAC